MCNAVNIKLWITESQNNSLSTCVTAGSPVEPLLIMCIAAALSQGMISFWFCQWGTQMEAGKVWARTSLWSMCRVVKVYHKRRLCSGKVYHKRRLYIELSKQHRGREQHFSLDVWTSLKGEHENFDIFLDYKSPVVIIGPLTIAITKNHSEGLNI